mmetsp:Transcript_21490/g.50143  ORF Transcript_21490/g.50143 Transcript_21490/m.50143 type:complete len:205 (-) Transcript_21490:1320-1934(-)
MHGCVIALLASGAALDDAVRLPVVAVREQASHAGGHLGLGASLGVDVGNGSELVPRLLPVHAPINEASPSSSWAPTTRSLLPRLLKSDDRPVLGGPLQRRKATDRQTQRARTRQTRPCSSSSPARCSRSRSTPRLTPRGSRARSGGRAGCRWSTSTCSTPAGSSAPGRARCASSASARATRCACRRACAVAVATVAATRRRMRN